MRDSNPGAASGSGEGVDDIASEGASRTVTDKPFGFFKQCAALVVITFGSLVVFAAIGKLLQF